MGTRFAARSKERVWHWVETLYPGSAFSKCGVEFEWRRAIVPESDFKIDLDSNDTLCQDCGNLPDNDWADYIVPYGTCSVKI